MNKSMILKKSFMHNQFSNAEQAHNNFESFFKFLSNENSLSIYLEVSANEFNGDPLLKIKANNQEFFSKHLSEADHILDLNIDVKDQQQILIEISMEGKKTNDTMINSRGDIIKDKFILIKKFKINEYDIISDADLFYSLFKYINNDTGKEETVKSGFWSNATLKLDCSLPFGLWYQKNTKKNINLSDNMKYLDNKNLSEQQFAELRNKLNLLL
jgi:hypothetical protein